MAETDPARNNLASENSLYLRQHQDNPVHWQPWGAEAFAEAERRGVPVIVSIGYSSCHWCHVMEHESFEDDYIADLMNRHYVCIKVDREERPDVDQIYMEAVQMITGRGGWPLNVFCFADGRPFFGGTYFPPEDRGHGIVPWPQLLMRISDYYQKNRTELEENADNIIKNMLHANAPTGADGSALANEDLLKAAEGILSQHDGEWGGFGEAPKFPPSMTLDFLLALRSTKAAESRVTFAREIDEAVQKTLNAMARGGIFDQVGGGFARYSVDRHWIIPHFEKMLYDNGLLLDIFSKGYLRYGNPLYANIVEETIGWLQREMLAPGGAFYASLDADTDGEEGKTYVWTPDEVVAILGEDEGKAFCDAYLITPKGNFEHGTSNPAFASGSLDVRDTLASAREKLLAARNERPQPGRDTKILLAWNALAIRGLATAGFAFNNKAWFVLARTAADFLWDNLRREDGRLWSVYYEDAGPKVNANLDDYTYFIEANLAIAAWADWLEPGLSKVYTERADTLMQDAFKHFLDEIETGFFFTSDDHEELISRKKSWFDNATPSGNSSLVQSLSSLYALTANDQYSTELAELRRAYPGMAERAPSAVAHALSAYTSDAMGIAVIKVKGIADLQPLRDALATRPWRKVFVQLTDEERQPDGYQLCVGTQCLEPTSDVDAVAGLL